MDNSISDLQPHNILLGIKDKTIFSQFEKAELEDPSPRKFAGDHIIYQSRPLRPSFGLPVLCDFGEARLGNEEHDDDIMPDVYRAPEVILNMKWGYKVDVWNVGVMVSNNLLIHIQLLGFDC